MIAMTEENLFGKAAKDCREFWSNLFHFAPPAIPLPTGLPANPPLPTPAPGAPAAAPAGAQTSSATQKAADAANSKGKSTDVEQTTGKCCPPPPWMPIALGELKRGVAEIDGPKANPRILDYFKAAKFWGTDDSGVQNAWCASYVAWVMKTAGYPIAKDAFRAKEWSQNWPGGEKIDRPIYGAIAVKDRKGGGHVGFVMGKDPSDSSKIHLLGGNQHNKISIVRYPKSDFTAFMAPKTYPHACCELPKYTGYSEKSGSDT